VISMEEETEEDEWEIEEDEEKSYTNKCQD
jgi:hypothetical protein